MLRATRFVLIWLLLAPFVCSNVFAAPDDEDRADYENARVARISFVRGDVQVRRADSREWEEVVPNLPLTAGDRVATGQDAIVEIQFDRDNYLRLAENSILKIVTLSDGGVAVGLPEGALSLRIGRYKKDREFFEIDAPETTVAIEREGLYRVDAPAQTRSLELLLTVRDNGQARVYTENSAYAVRSGKTARILLDGESAGDVDFSAAYNPDRFDDFVATREDNLSRLRRAEYYGYYDPAIYGADDLNDYGDWIYTDRYGWVWRPSRAATAAYENWSPFRYGHWRYVPGYGWTWIAQEPWGWATSHYGRWVWVDNYWSWCPYEDRARSRRARWQSALVIFVNVGRDICWYPQPWGYSSRYNPRSRRVVYNTTIINNNTVVVNPTPTPLPTPVAGNPNDVPRRGIDQLRDRMRNQSNQIDLVYAGAVSKMPAENFGKITRGIERVRPDEAVRAVDALKNGERQIDLPEYKENDDARVKRGLEIVNRRASLKDAERELETNEKIGATPRQKDRASDAKLRDERVFKGRMPVARGNDNGDNGGDSDNNARQPRTGIFDRQPRQRDKSEQNGGGEKPREDIFERPTPRQPRSPKTENNDGGKPRETDSNRDFPIERPKVRPEQPREERKEEPKNDDSDNNRRPTFEPPRQKEPEHREEPRREEPRREIPREEPKREEPRREEPKREEPPREEPRREEPRRETPREEPKREAPPSRSEMKSEKDN